MNNLKEYIIEKLKLDKNIKVSNEEEVIDSLANKIYYEAFERFESIYHIDTETENKLKEALNRWLTDTRACRKKKVKKIWMYSYNVSGSIVESNKRMVNYYIEKLNSQSSLVLFTYDQDKEKRFTIRCAEKLRGSFDPIMLITTPKDKFIVIDND